MRGHAKSLQFAPWLLERPASGGGRKKTGKPLDPKGRGGEKPLYLIT